MKNDTTKRLETELPKNRNQVVIANNVFGDYYRINWFDKDVDDFAACIGKSVFALVTIIDGKLNVENRTVVHQRRQGILGGCLG